VRRWPCAELSPKRVRRLDVKGGGSGGHLHLRTGVAGEMLQKFVNYGVKLAILGDVSGYTTASSALRDFIYESNRGETIWFVANRHELEQRLG
jgi:hypothetical protein